MIYLNNNTLKTMCNTYIAFGSFDGMHKGHLKLLKELASKGKKDKKYTVAISFHSSADTQNTVLSTEDEKALYAEQAGVDCFISFDTGKTQLTKEQLFKDVIIGQLGAELIFLGQHNRSIDMAASLGCNFITVETEYFQEKPLTSALVRNCIMECEFEVVTQMCQHPYIMMGEVVHGKALGRTVGMPTANLSVPANKLKPPSGVYATRSFIEEEPYQGLTNIGTRPSVDDLPIITIETFLLDFSKDIYGKKLIMEVHKYIRGVKKFDNLEEVQAQVQKDLTQVQNFLSALN